MIDVDLKLSNTDAASSVKVKLGLMGKDVVNIAPVSNMMVMKESVIIIQPAMLVVLPGV